MQNIYSEKVSRGNKSSQGSKKHILVVAILTLLFAITYSHFFEPLPPRENHPYDRFDNIWTESELSALWEMWQTVPAFKTVKEDATSQIPHIGEAVPPLPDGTCPHRYLIPRKLLADGNSSESTTLCVLPDRIDVAHHHFKSGGIAGRKERFDSMIGRLLAFHQIQHAASNQLAQTRAIESLFKSQKYLDAASRVCPGKPVLDRIQLGIIVLVPGQEVAMHYDVPWFLGATRYDLPQWLLVVMAQSQLFEDKLWPQVQGVAYIHKKNVTGGSFFFWNDGPAYPMNGLQAVPNTGVVLDGSVVAHGVQPFGKLSVPSLKMSPNGQYQLKRSEDADQWAIWRVDNPEHPERISPAYDTDELRVSLVWRARCFTDEQEKAAWHSAPKLTLQHVLRVLKRDLRSRGVLGLYEEPAPLDLAILLLNTYIKYPYSESATIPYNYCMLGKLSPIFSTLLTPFCD